MEASWKTGKEGREEWVPWNSGVQGSGYWGHWDWIEPFLRIPRGPAVSFRGQGNIDFTRGAENRIHREAGSSIPGLGRSLEEEMATHSSILAWEIPWTEQPSGLQPMGSQRVGLKQEQQSFTQHAFTEHLLHSRNSSRLWGCTLK